MKRLLALAVLAPIVPVVAVIGLAVTADAAPLSGGCGAGGPGTQVGSVTLNAEQLANAQIIVTTTQQTKLPPYASVVAVATAMTESTLHNYLAQTDHDSEGLFQQRVSVYTARVASNPTLATQAFLQRLVGVPNWQTIPLTAAAATVQIPRRDLRDQYAQWQQLGTDLTSRYWHGGTATAAPCADDGSATGSPVTGVGLPAGYRLPADPTLAAVVGFALHQLGKPYVYATEGPDTYDCSGLVLAAWAVGGLALPRTTYFQVGVGTPVGSLAAMTPGDLIFIPGADGTEQHPGHVGMYIGAVGGSQYLVHAPQTGDVVKVSTVASWSSEIVAIRHPSAVSTA